MDIRERLYEAAKRQYHPEDVTPFIYAHHVVCVFESENGEIYTGFSIEGCCGVMVLCAEKVAALNMGVNSGQTVERGMIAFSDKPPYGEDGGMPCSACREFFTQLFQKTKIWRFQLNYSIRKTEALEALMPKWRGAGRYSE